MFQDPVVLFETGLLYYVFKDCYHFRGFLLSFSLPKAGVHIRSRSHNVCHCRHLSDNRSVTFQSVYTLHLLKKKKTHTHTQVKPIVVNKNLTFVDSQM